LPKGFILYVQFILVWKLFLGNGKTHALGRKWTALTPTVTVIVDTTDVFVVCRELQEIFIFHNAFFLKAVFSRFQIMVFTRR
jgi:hypothetical protein